MLNEEAALAGMKTKAEANSKEIAKNGRNCRLPNIQFLLKACGVAIVQHQ